MAEPGRASSPRNIIHMQKHAPPIPSQARLGNGRNQLIVIESTEVRHDSLFLSFSLQQKEVLVCLCGGEGQCRG